MTTKKLPEDDTYVPDPLPGDEDKKPKKEKSTYAEDPTDPNYVEPRLRPDYDPTKPG